MSYLTLMSSFIASAAHSDCFLDKFKAGVAFCTMYRNIVCEENARECLFNISPGCLLSGITLALALHCKMLLHHTKVTPWLQRCISVFVHTVKDRALTVFLELWSKLKLSNCYAKLLSLIYRLHSCKFSALHENSTFHPDI